MEMNTNFGTQTHAGAAGQQPASPPGPLQVVTCRKMHAAQYKTMYRMLQGRKWGFLFGMLLAGNILLFLQLIIRFRLYPKDWETYVFMGLMLAAFAAGIIAAVWIYRRFYGGADKAYACYLDSASDSGVIELYNDRAVRITAAGKVVIPFARVNQLLETADMIILGCPGRAIAWRAEDMTPYDAQFLMACLQQRIFPGYHRRKAPFYPWLREPLPLPVIHSEEPVWLRVRVEPSACRGWFWFWRQVQISFLAIVFPLMQIAGILAVDAHMTPSLLLDWAVYAAAAVLLWTGVLLLMYKVRPAAAPVNYAFTPSGFAVKIEDTVGFVNKRHVRPKNGRRAAALHTPYGCYLIPWASVGDPQTLKTILSLE